MKEENTGRKKETTVPVINSTLDSSIVPFVDDTVPLVNLTDSSDVDAVPLVNLTASVVNINLTLDSSIVLIVDDTVPLVNLTDSSDVDAVPLVNLTAPVVNLTLDSSVKTVVNDVNIKLTLDSSIDDTVPLVNLTDSSDVDAVHLVNLTAPVVNLTLDSSVETVVDDVVPLVNLTAPTTDISGVTTTGSSQTNSTLDSLEYEESLENEASTKKPYGIISFRVYTAPPTGSRSAPIVARIFILQKQEPQAEEPRNPGTNANIFPQKNE